MKIVFVLIALSALAAACHEQRQDDAPTRAHADDSQSELQRQTPPPASQVQ